MSSSISNSRELRFVVWVLAGVAISALVGSLDVWTGVMNSHRQHVAIAKLFGADVDYAILGDSKTAPFSHDHSQRYEGGGVAAGLDPKGLVFSSDSVTPAYHLFNLRRVREAAPAFQPRTVFISLGANNFNRVGLHCRRDMGLYSLLTLREAAALTVSAGEYGAFAEVLLSRLFPVYQHRVQLTHFQFAWRPDPTAGVSPETRQWKSIAAAVRDAPEWQRDPVEDRGYEDIYRRSVYNDFEYSDVMEAAVAALVEEIRDLGAEPVLMLLPVSAEMLALERALVGPAFDTPLRAFAENHDLELLDLRAETGYAFADANHLTERAAIQLWQERLAPLLDRARVSRSREVRDPPQPDHGMTTDAD